MDEYVWIVSNDPMDYVKVALALEMLAYHNKNYLDSVMCCDAKRSVEIQYLLKTAIEKAEERKAMTDLKPYPFCCVGKRKEGVDG